MVEGVSHGLVREVHLLLVGSGREEFLVDDEFSAADIMAAYSLTLAQLVGELPAEPKSIHVWLAGLAARPAYKISFEGGFG